MRGARMKVRSGHIVFPPNVKYKDLASIWKELFQTFIAESHQTSKEDQEIAPLIMQSNLQDMQKNRKPEGYNRLGAMKMIFPIRTDRVEFYIYKLGAKTIEVARVTEALSRFLQAKGYEHDVKWDKMLLYILKRQQDMQPSQRTGTILFLDRPVPDAITTVGEVPSVEEAAVEKPVPEERPAKVPRPKALARKAKKKPRPRPKPRPKARTKKAKKAKAAAKKPKKSVKKKK